MLLYWGLRPGLSEVYSEVVADRESVKEITTKKAIDICYQYINTVNLYKSKAMTMTKKAIIRSLLET